MHPAKRSLRAGYPYQLFTDVQSLHGQSIWSPLLNYKQASSNPSLYECISPLCNAPARL